MKKLILVGLLFVTSFLSGAVGSVKSGLNCNEFLRECIAKREERMQEAYYVEYAACVKACEKIAWDKKFISNFWPKEDVTAGDLLRCARKASFDDWLAIEKAVVEYLPKKPIASQPIQ